MYGWYRWCCWREDEEEFESFTEFHVWLLIYCLGFLGSPSTILFLYFIIIIFSCHWHIILTCLLLLSRDFQLIQLRRDIIQAEIYSIGKQNCHWACETHGVCEMRICFVYAFSAFYSAQQTRVIAVPSVGRLVGWWLDQLWILGRFHWSIPQTEKHCGTASVCGNNS